MARFTNKVCLVTGAGSGIGRATALRLAEDGGCVMVLDIEEEKGKETVQMISEKGGEAIFRRCDVAKETDIAASVAEAVEKWGKTDIVVNNAAMMTFTRIVDLSTEDWDNVMHVNLRSVFLFCKYSIPHINGGAIISVSSVHARETTPNVIPYASSKGAMEAFVRGASLEYPADKVRFACVAPGSVDTPMLWNNPEVKSGVEKPEGNIGRPEDIAAAICFLASDEACFVNGITLIVDGGKLAGLS